MFAEAPGRFPALRPEAPGSSFRMFVLDKRGDWL